MTSYDYTSFSSTSTAVPFTYSQVVYERLIYIFVLHMQGRSEGRGSACLIKTQPEKLLICICLSRMRRSTSPLSAQRLGCEDPKGAIAPVCPFYGGSKLWTGAAICFCPPLKCIYSPSLAIKLTIYDLLFN